MDRLRSLQYFIASAEEGSFSGAARRLEVTIPAIAKMIGSLERDLGVALFERSAQGLALTAAGETYLESCRQPVAAIQQLDEQMRGAGTKARGTVVVGIQHVAAHDLLAPYLPRLHARFPEISVDLREATQVLDPDAPGIDCYISLGWPKREDMVHVALGRSGFRVCASPSYWAARGIPKHPADLVHHECMLIRTQTGTVMDVWLFERGGKTEEVTVKGWLVCNNNHRDVVVRMAVAGQGVVRILDWSAAAEIESGTLVPVLQDWSYPDAPPIVLSYRPSSRRVARVRLFTEFVREIFREMGGLSHASSVGPQPWWAGTKARKASGMPRS